MSKLILSSIMVGVIFSLTPYLASASNCETQWYGSEAGRNGNVNAGMCQPRGDTSIYYDNNNHKCVIRSVSYPKTPCYDCEYGGDQCGFIQNVSWKACGSCNAPITVRSLTASQSY